MRTEDTFPGLTHGKHQPPEAEPSQPLLGLGPGLADVPLPAGLSLSGLVLVLMLGAWALEQ